jgi:hypothetical protein
MEQAREKESRLKSKTIIGVLTGILWLLLVGYKIVSQSDTYLKYAPIVLILMALPIALFLQGRLLNTFKKEGDNPVHRDLKRAFGFFLGAGIVVSGELVATLVTELKLSGFSIGGITIFFLYLSLLFFVRTGFLKLWVGIGKKLWEDKTWRLATGYTDLLLVLAHGAAYGIFLGSFSFRVVVTVLVIGGVRVAWAYIPEDRLEVVREFIQFLGERKLWWMAPIFIVMALLMILVLLTQTTGGSFPFIYAVF